MVMNFGDKNSVIYCFRRYCAVSKMTVLLFQKIETVLLICFHESIFAVGHMDAISILIEK